MNSSFISNKGKRKSNQDVVLIKNLDSEKDMYLLADGMGGYKHGEYAANFIVSQLSDLIEKQEAFDEVSIQFNINEVTSALAKINKKQETNMGATLGGVIREKDLFHCFWVGDVKIIHISENKIVYESNEHTLKNDLIEKKVFVEAKNAKKYNHIVTRSIQNNIEKSKIDYKCIDNFKIGDILIIQSDGVTDVIDNFQLLNILQSEEKVPEILSKLDERLKNIAEDNYSFLLIN